jgi:ArsR family transcriptional regulator
MVRIDTYRYIPHGSAVPAALTRSTVLASGSAGAPSTSVTDVATVLRALGDPTRLAIVAMLAREHGALCACHIESRFRLAQPTISHHLRVLRDVGMVTSEKRGTWIYYALHAGRLAELPGLAELLASITPFAGRETTCCT